MNDSGTDQPARMAMAFDDAASTWQRRVVMFADLVESVRLMRRNESDAVSRWRRFVAEARDHLVPTHLGRVVRTAGDGLLIEFDAVVPAVAAGFALHDALSAMNLGRADADAMFLRVGIHIADVVFEVNDVLGAGVNLAARLASLAQPGQVVVSALAREGLVDGLHARLSDLGLRYLKHVDEPVRAFVADPVSRTSAPQRMPSAAQDLRPAVAVVPFSALPADPAHDALGHAMADEIIAALARHPGLRVLSRISTAGLRGSALGAEQMHQLLGASFALTGRYYVMGDQVRLTVELCSLPDAEVLWAGGASAGVRAFFAGDDDLVPHIVSNVGRQVLARELERASSLPVDTLASYTLFLGACGLMNSLEPASFERARLVFEHLAERHPRHAAPYAKLAHWYVFKSVQGWSADPEADSNNALELARRATEIDPNQAIALASEGLVRMNFHHDAEAARRLYEAAVAVNPSEAHAWGNKTAVHSFSGEHQQACESAQRSIAVSPLDPMRFLFESWAAMATLGAGRFDEAVIHARASVRLNTVHFPALRMLIAALWLSGRHEEARETVKRYLALRPQARVGPPRPALAGEQPVWSDRYLRALLDAGVPP